MALDYAHGAIQWLTTDAVTATKVVSGLAFQPKALHFWVCGGPQSAVDASSDTAHWTVSVGVATGTADRRCVCSYSQDTPTAAACGVAYRTTCVICLTDGAAADGGQLDLSAIAADGFTLRVDVQNTIQHVSVFWEAWGGDTITNAATGEISEPAATGAVDYTVTGSFQPVMVLFASTKQLTADGASAIDSGIGVGCATENGQWVFCVNSDDGSTTMDTDRYGRSDECVAVITEAGGNPNARASFVQFNSDGFRLNWTARATSNRKTIYLAIAGGAWAAGTYTINASVLNTQTTVRTPFSPVGCSQATHGFSEQAAGTSTTYACLSMGCFSSASSRRAMGVIDEDGVGFAEIDSAIAYAAVIVFPNVTGAPPGAMKALDVASVNGDGFVMNVDTAGGASTDLVGFLAFASAMTGSFSDPIGIGVVPVP
jgi:hypothetical protein